MGRNVVIAVTGASGSIYAHTLFEQLYNIREQLENVALIFSDNAKSIWKHEMGKSFENKYGFGVYETNDFSAPFASGSSYYDTMLVVPCSMGMLGRIAAGISNDLITRSADVILKEDRKLVLMLRDTPFNLIHIENMRKILLSGGKIFPAIPSFYNHPESLDELVENLVLRLLDNVGFDVAIKRW